ncbi:protease modulator HflC [Pararhodospirillum photometricum]|uniref:Protein HflC n=1 Tax=Pararhodospirillum photometricum DSM 122 TaxID=1150469 RepID=H6SII1_PARPM|nr:protease modulator HflC [Pararhodospirillum photometricum]CCG06747.1 HflC [Pararhodospirillum photometricum DSM 122]
MKKSLLIALAVLAGVVLLGLYNALFVVAQSQQAVVFQFGQFVRTIQTPGLHLKIPVIQNVVFYDRRVLELNPPAEQVILADQKRLVVDTYLRYRISDPLRFYQAVNNEFQAASRLSDIVISALRRVLGNASLATLLSPERGRLMQEMKQAVDREAKELGIAVTDMRIRRADLPEETSQAIFARIRSEREREAREFRAQGQEMAQQIRARADREKVVLLAEAQKRAQELRGEGDAQAVTLYADAFGADPAFFDFYRSLQAYKKALGDGSTTMVLSPEGDFFRFFGAGAEPAAREAR